MSVRRGKTTRMVMLSMLSACGLVLFVFESFMPLLPWFRPGLGNIATILALMLFGFGDSLKVTVLRISLGALVLGRLFSPVFLLAFGGGLASALAMGIAHRFGKRVFGPVGISVTGAVAHNLAELGIACLLFVKSVELFIFTPIFLLAGILTGVLTGLVSALVLERVQKRRPPCAGAGE